MLYKNKRQLIYILGTKLVIKPKDNKGKSKKGK